MTPLASRYACLRSPSLAAQANDRPPVDADYFDAAAWNRRHAAGHSGNPLSQEIAFSQALPQLSRPDSRTGDRPASNSLSPARASARLALAECRGLFYSLYPCRNFLGMRLLTAVQGRKPTSAHKGKRPSSFNFATGAPQSNRQFRAHLHERGSRSGSQRGRYRMTMQTEFRIMGSATRPKKAHSAAELAACKTKAHACRLALLHSGLSQEAVAERIYVTGGYLSMLLSGKRKWQDDLQHRFMNVTGSFAPLQWDAMREGVELYIDKVKEERALLLARVAELDRQEAA